MNASNISRHTVLVLWTACWYLEIHNKWPFQVKICLILIRYWESSFRAWELRSEQLFSLILHDKRAKGWEKRDWCSEGRYTVTVYLSCQIRIRKHHKPIGLETLEPTILKLKDPETLKPSKLRINANHQFGEEIMLYTEVEPSPAGPPYWM